MDSNIVDNQDHNNSRGGYKKAKNNLDLHAS